MDVAGGLTLFLAFLFVVHLFVSLSKLRRRAKDLTVEETAVITRVWAMKIGASFFVMFLPLAASLLSEALSRFGPQKTAVGALVGVAVLTISSTLVATVVYLLERRNTSSR